jgi:hypothetical protein
MGYMEWDMKQLHIFKKYRAQWRCIFFRFHVKWIFHGEESLAPSPASHNRLSLKAQVQNVK